MAPATQGGLDRAHSGAGTDIADEDGQMPRPAVRAFGSLRLELEGRTLGPRDLGGRKPKLLLEILLLADGHPVPRERLASLLWERNPPRNVPGTIDTYVSVLRRTLGRHRELLVTEHAAYRLLRPELRVDLDRFDELTARAAGCEHETEQRELLAEALALANGDVLEDEPYAHWLQDTRAHYRRRVLDIRMAAGTVALSLGDASAARRHGERVRADDPLDERAYRLVMVAHQLAGVRSAALEAYERCREILVEELGTDPSQATQDLHQAILRGRPVSELVAELSGATRRHQPAPAAARRGRAMRVLLVEDTPAEAQLIITALESGDAPVQVDHILDGETALEVLRRGHPHPDLVLLDLGLPGLSGHEVLAELKQDPSLRRIPVVMLTSSTMQDDVARSYDLHANSYVTKPTDPDELAEVVRAIEAFWPLTAASGTDREP
jgi:DNA-binding SARP family transcriptional activator/ActR/RegA family two-component response regulator